MKRYIRSEKGNIIFSVSIFGSILLVFFILFAIIISKSNFNLLIHEARSDIYLIARNAVFALEREMMGEDIEEADYDRLLDLVEQGMKETWDLDGRLKNGRGLIKQAKIEELMFLETYDTDPVTYKVTPTFSLHIVVKLSFKPIILTSVIEDKYEIFIHEDIRMEKMQLEEGE